jgi:hypothetical protein
MRFGEAVRHHAAGRLDAADAAYRAILLDATGHAASLHGRGVIARIRPGAATSPSS